MAEFLEFMDALPTSYHIHMAIYYSMVLDWIIHVWQEKQNVDRDVCYIQTGDMHLAFAKALVEVKEYISQHADGRTGHADRITGEAGRGEMRK